MAMGRQGDRQGDLMVMWSEMPRSPGHVFYDRLQEVLVGAGLTASWRTPAERSTPRPWARPQYRPVGTFACTWSGTSRGSTASAGWSGISD